MIRLVSLVSVFFLTGFQLMAQPEIEKAIVEEGKKLYRLEMASWYGTDLLRTKYPDKLGQVAGYFSYEDDDGVKCIFFNAFKPATVTLSISFDSTYNIETAQVSTSQRELSEYEQDIVEMRKKALAEIESDTLFNTYNDTNLNLIPVIDEKGKRLYVLTGTTRKGVVIFGNDYLITFDEQISVISKNKIHQNLIVLDWHSANKKEVGSTHTHLPETGELITATDICTLMLYQKFTGWKTHMVVSWKYISMWHCESNVLTVIPQKELNKSVKDEKRKN